MKVIELCTVTGNIQALLEEQEDTMRVYDIMEQLGYIGATFDGLPLVKINQLGTVCHFYKTY